jgi:hypothetical protein
MIPVEVQMIWKFSKQPSDTPARFDVTIASWDRETGRVTEYEGEFFAKQMRDRPPSDSDLDWLARIGALK